MKRLLTSGRFARTPRTGRSRSRSVRGRSWLRLLRVCKVRNDDQGATRLVKKDTNNTARDDVAAALVLGAALADLPRPAIVAAVRSQYDGNRELGPRAAVYGWLAPFRSYKSD